MLGVRRFFAGESLGFWLQFSILVVALCSLTTAATGQTYPFDDITAEVIREASLSSSDINSNQFHPDTILLYRTNQGRYGKLLVEGYANDLTGRWVTYNAGGLVFSQGTTLTVRGTFCADLDSGVEVSCSEAAADFWWNQVASNPSYLVPEHGALFAIFSCSYRVTPVFIDISGTGCTFSGYVGTLIGCNWSFTDIPSWITINSGASGSGSGDFTSTISPNPESVMRYASLRVGDADGGSTLVVAQNGRNCRYSLNPPMATFSPTAGNGSFAIDTPTGCVWTVPGSDWPTVSSVTATAAPFGFGYYVGNGTVSYNFPANLDAADRTISLGFPFGFYLIQRGLQQPLTIVKGGSGVVTSTPSGINCGSTCTFNFPYNQQVTLTAQADANSTFDGWAGQSCSGTGSCVVTMSDPIMVGAQFRPLPNYRLDVVKAGSGTGTVTSSPPGIDCGSTCSYKFPYNQQVVLTAHAGADSIFYSWSGCSGSESCIVTMNQYRNVVATFLTIPTYALTVAKEGSGTGTVTSSPPGIDCGSTCVNRFPYNMQVVLTAQPDTNSLFGGWTWRECSSTGVCVVPMDRDRYVTAIFTWVGNRQLTVAKMGAGSGTVSSSPPGINCGNSCSFTFPYDSQVTLTASADANSEFAGWSGEGYSGTGSCMVTMNQHHYTKATFTAKQAPGSQVSMTLPPLGAGSYSTRGGEGSVRAGYATGNIDSGMVPYGTAVFSYSTNGVVVSEVGVPVSPPTTAARLFVDFRPSVSTKADSEELGGISVNTGFAAVNRGNGTAHLSLRLRDANGNIIVQGTTTLAPGAHTAKFIDQLAPDIVMPSDFGTAAEFASLDVTSDQPISVIALRLTTNQRGEALLTSTPIVDLTQSPPSGVVSFPQLVDGGGYQTVLILLNTSAASESGMIRLYDDNGSSMELHFVGFGPALASLPYTIPPGGYVRFQTDGSSSGIKAGSVQVIPEAGSNSPVGAGVFGYTVGGTLVTESGIPSATPTTHARIFVDRSGGHDTGLAIADPTGDSRQIKINAYQMDGTTSMGSGSINLSAYGHTAKFADELILSLPPGFRGILDISSGSPFAALTLRSLSNGRGDFLLTTFPIGDVTRPAPSPLIFPQIADGGGYQTQFILLSTTGAASATLSFFDDAGLPLAVGKRTIDHR